MYVHHTTTCRIHYPWPVSIASISDVCIALYAGAAQLRVEVLPQGGVRLTDGAIRAPRKEKEALQQEKVQPHHPGVHQSGTMCTAIQ